MEKVFYPTAEDYQDLEDFMMEGFSEITIKDLVKPFMLEGPVYPPYSAVC